MGWGFFAAEESHFMRSKVLKIRSPIFSELAPWTTMFLPQLLSQTPISRSEYKLNNPILQMTLGNWVLGRSAAPFNQVVLE